MDTPRYLHYSVFAEFVAVLSALHYTRGIAAFNSFAWHRVEGARLDEYIKIISMMIYNIDENIHKAIKDTPAELCVYNYWIEGINSTGCSKFKQIITKDKIIAELEKTQQILLILIEYRLTRFVLN